MWSSKRTKCNKFVRLSWETGQTESNYCDFQLSLETGLRIQAKLRVCFAIRVAVVVCVLIKVGGQDEDEYLEVCAGHPDVKCSLFHKTCFCMIRLPSQETITSLPLFAALFVAHNTEQCFHVFLTWECIPLTRPGLRS